jgi:hypothetical protein
MMLPGIVSTNPISKTKPLFPTPAATNLTPRGHFFENKNGAPAAFIHNTSQGNLILAPPCTNIVQQPGHTRRFVW